MTDQARAVSQPQVGALAEALHRSRLSCRHADAFGLKDENDHPAEARLILAALKGWTLTRAQPDEPSAVVVLREALLAILDHTREGRSSGPVYDIARRVLADTAPAATEARQQIEREAVDPWREALWRTRVHEMNYDGSPCWCPIEPMAEAAHDKDCQKARALLASAEGEK